MLLTDCCFVQEGPTVPVDIYSGLMNIKWKEGAPAPVGYLRHTAVWLNGLVYVGGGIETGWELSFTINCYDPLNNSWGSPIKTPYCNFVLVVLNNNLLTAGGEGRIRKTNEVLKLHNGQLKEYTQMFTARTSATAAGYLGVLIIAGGVDNKCNILSTTELFDSNNGQWYNCNDLPQPHFRLQSVIVDNTLYMIGGANKNDDATLTVFTAVLDTLSNHQLIWNVYKNTPWYRSAPVSVQNTHLLLIGGRNHGYVTYSDVYKLNNARYNWEIMGNIPSARDSLAAVSTTDNRIIVIGGWNQWEDITNSVWIGSYESQ